MCPLNQNPLDLIQTHLVAPTIVELGGACAAVVGHDVKAVSLEIVTVGQPLKDTPDGTLGVECTGLIPPLIKAVQELKASNDNLRAMLEKQGRDIEELKAARQ